MPYKIVKQDGKECVAKESGETKHCYSGPKAHSQALAYMRALYAAEGSKKEIGDIDKELSDLGMSTKEIEDLSEKCMENSGMGPYVPWGVRSFEELDAWKAQQETAQEVSSETSAFQQIVSNIMGSYELQMNEKLAAVKELADEFASRVDTAINEPDDEHKESAEQEFIELLDDESFPDGEADKAKRADVSEADKKRAEGEYGNVAYADPTNKKYPIDNEKHIRAAWSYINMPKNAAKYSDGGAAIKRKIIAAWKKKIDAKGPPEAAKKELSFDEIVSTVVDKVKDILHLPKVDKTTDNFMAYKEADGTYRWIARYSNNFRDRDDPPEIISAASHQRFTERVNKGLAPLPSLWIWHVKDWNIGKADWVAWDDAGFALAGGRSNPGAEPIFEQIEGLKEVRVSHGMPKSTIVYDPADPSIIIEHETREISILPDWAAANPLTGFVAINTESKEADMAISKEQKEELAKKWGLSEESIKLIEAQNAKDAEKAKDEKMESKETATPTEPAAATPAEVPATTEPEAKDESVDATPVAVPTETPVKELNETEKAIKSLTEAVTALTAQVAEMKEKQASAQEAVDKAVRETPAASILSMFGGLGDGSAIGKAETQVDGRTTLAKSKPAEPKVNVEGRTFVPFINEILAGK